MIKFKDYEQSQLQLLPPNLVDLIDPEDPVLVVNRVIDKLGPEILYKPFTSATGQPPYHPLMMIKLIIFSYTQGIFSCRKMEKAAWYDIRFMWLCAMQTPDYKTINRFRSKYFAEVLKDIFAEVVLLMLEEGYIKGEDYFVDGTKIAANANKHSHVWKKNVHRYKQAALDRAAEIVKEADRINESECCSEETESNSASASKKAKEIEDGINDDDDYKTKRKKKSLGAKLRKESEKIKKYEDQEECLNGRNSYSKTDNEATFLRMKNEELLPAYNLQVGTENGFICGISIHQNANDGAVFIDHMRKRELMRLAPPKRVIADAGYGHIKNYDYLDDNKIEAYLKYPSFSIEESRLKQYRFHNSKFMMNKDGEIFCPAGNKMNRIDAEVLHIRQSSFVCDQCHDCEFLSECAKGKTERTLYTSKRLRRRQKKARDLLDSSMGYLLRKRRGNEVESVFGDMKHNLKLRQFSLRGLEKVTLESILYALAFNIRKMATTNPLYPLFAQLFLRKRGKYRSIFAL